MIYYNYEKLTISDWAYDFYDSELKQIMEQYDAKQIKTLEEGIFEKCHYLFNDEETMTIALTHLQILGHDVSKVLT